MAMPEIGRSGKDLRVAYKLFAMEQQEPELGGEWVRRQTATYHTLDLVEWKTFWITVKANDLIQDRIMFDWCSDGWGWYINEVSDKVEEILRPATAALIPSEKDSLDPVPGIMRSLSSSLSSPREKRGAQINEKMLPPARSGSSAVPNSPDMITRSGSTSGTVGQDLGPQIKSTTDRLNVLKNFSFSGVRQLDTFCNKLRDAKTAIAANLSITGEISEIYKNLLESASSSPADIDRDLVDAVRQFQDYLRSIAHNLKSDCLRVDNILERMSDGKNLYYHILDLQRTELDKLYAINQHVTSQRMEDSSSAMEKVTTQMHAIAKRTERDTASMHFITFLTLVFLPGPFSE
ncbi:serine threonine kinase [Apiospora phragmitis]|uniref:Serine threonine kinase n=1 Tax=Apiospora phragmitis TaxID=2905665 RepID=A0ABR1TNF3_9PEZI